MPDPAYEVDEAIAKLAAHGSARQIADYLIQEGCAGRRNNSWSCPVATYITRTTGVHVMVGGQMWADAKGGSRVRSRGAIPSDVGDFVHQFDRGGFPELDRDR